MHNRNVLALPPEEFADLQLKSPKTKAAGVPGVLTAFKHLHEEMGLLNGIAVLGKMNQKGGFDCPGCAWPDPDGKRSAFFEYCENGAKALAEEKTKKQVDAGFFSKYSVEELSTWTDYAIGKAGRIVEPMYLPKGENHYQPISWNDAFSLIAAELKSLSHPDEAIFYTSGRTSNEAAFMYQLFVRQFGTNNLPDCSNMCHESSGVGLGETIGIGKGTVTLQDIHQSDLILVMGQNPGTNHPRMLAALEKCKKNGGTLVSINPLPETGTNVFVDPQNPMAILSGGSQLADVFLQIKINGDVALLKGVMHLLYQEEQSAPGSVFDHEFINTYCDNYPELLEHLANVDLEACCNESGITQAEMAKLAKLIIQKPNMIVCWAMGLTQHENGVDNIKEIVNLLLLRGSIGKKGAGACPVRGHSNVQGDRTMGIWEKPKPAFLDKLDQHFGIKSPRAHGFDTVDAIEAMHADKAKVFIGMGGNFVSATPDSAYTGEALQNMSLTVQVSTKLNRSHLVTGEHALILPCISRAEEDLQNTEKQFVTIENSMGVVHSSQGSFKPASQHLRSEPAIISGMALATFGSQSPIDWEAMQNHYDVVRDHIEATIPGFENYNERVRKPGGFYLPNGPRDRKFTTPNGKAQFSVVELPQRKIAANRLVLMTIRTHDQFNTTIYGMDDRYRGIYNERRVILMHPDDMKAQGLEKLDVVHITSYYQEETRKVGNFKVIPFPVARGCVASYFPECNPLISIKSKAKYSHTPVSKFVEISLEKG